MPKPATDTKRSDQGGPSKNKVVGCVRAINEAHEAARETREELNETIATAVEEHGVHQKAIKDAARLMRLEAKEPGAGQEYFRALEDYCDKAGLFAQTSLFDDRAEKPKRGRGRPSAKTGNGASAAVH